MVATTCPSNTIDPAIDHCWTIVQSSISIRAFDMVSIGRAIWYEGGMDQILRRRRISLVIACRVSLAPALSFGEFISDITEISQTRSSKSTPHLSTSCRLPMYTAFTTKEQKSPKPAGTAAGFSIYLYHQTLQEQELGENVC